MEEREHHAQARIVPAADVVLIGGGHAHVQVIEQYATLSVKPFRLTLVSDEALTPYSGMLPGLIAGHYSKSDAHIDLGHLCLRSGVRFLLATATNISLSERFVTLVGRDTNVPFEALSIDIGSKPNIPGTLIEGGHDGSVSIGIKPVAAFLRHLEELDSLVAKSSREKPFRLVILGGGVAGCEVALALSHRWSSEGRTIGRFRIKILESSDTLTPQLTSPARHALTQTLKRVQIQIATKSAPSSVDLSARTMRLSDGSELEFDQLLWTTSAAAHDWLAKTGLATDENGFIQVGPTLESVSHEGVYAAGDTASLPGELRRPKAGVFAVRQGPILFENLFRRFRGMPAVRYRPQTKFLMLISLGSRVALGVHGNLAFTSMWAWVVKDWIDRRFMRRFRTMPLPVKIATYIESGNLAETPCTACGSKLPADVLTELPTKIAPKSDIVCGVASREDCSVIALSDDKANPHLIQSLDYIRSFASDLELVGRVATAHCLNDIYAMGVTPHSAHVLATVAFGPKAAMRRDLAQLMGGISRALLADSVALIGGHSQAGFHPGVGVMAQAIAKDVKPELLWSKRHLQIGDQLLITKPIGSGILLAGYMRYHVSTEHLYSAFSTMAQSHRLAVERAARHGVRAATDVTGFGLAAHLAEMCQQSAVNARIDLRLIPTYPGSYRALEAGIRASLHAQNRQAFAPILRKLDDRALLLAETLFDPQTAGGLLFGVPKPKAQDLCDALRHAGFERAAIFGEVVPAAPGAEQPLEFFVPAGGN